MSDQKIFENEWGGEILCLELRRVVNVFFKSYPFLIRLPSFGQWLYLMRTIGILRENWPNGFKKSKGVTDFDMAGLLWEFTRFTTDLERLANRIASLRSAPMKVNWEGEWKAFEFDGDQMDLKKPNAIQKVMVGLWMDSIFNNSPILSISDRFLSISQSENCNIRHLTFRTVENHVRVSLSIISLSIVRKLLKLFNSQFNFFLLFMDSLTMMFLQHNLSIRKLSTSFCGSSTHKVFVHTVMNIWMMYEPIQV
jgi:hypothetical protein